MGRVLPASRGLASTLWVIDENGQAGAAVKQFSATGELLRALPFETYDPQPVQIIADPAKDTIHLLEISPRETRVRSLTLERLEQEPATDGDPRAVSNW